MDEIPSQPRLDRTAISISDEMEDRETREWWHRQTPLARLEHMQLLRLMNYGPQAAARLQRVLEVAELPAPSKSKDVVTSQRARHTDR